MLGKEAHATFRYASENSPAHSCFVFVFMHTCFTAKCTLQQGMRGCGGVRPIVPWL